MSDDPAAATYTYKSSYKIFRFSGETSLLVVKTHPSGISEVYGATEIGSNEMSSFTENVIKIVGYRTQNRGFILKVGMKPTIRMSSLENMNQRLKISDQESEHAL